MNIKSKYFDRFKRLREEGTELFKIRGNAILVEILEEKVVSKGGIEIVQDLRQVHGGVAANKGVVALVLAVGEGYYDSITHSDGTKEEITVPLDIQPGAIVLLPKYSVSTYSTFPGLEGITDEKIGMVLDSEIRLSYPSLESYEKAKNILK